LSVQTAERPLALPQSDWINRLDFLWLEVTNRCNLQCSHCYADSSPYEPATHGLKQDDWLRVLVEARGLGCQSVQFIGGEPLLHVGLEELIQKAHLLGYTFIEVFSNGTRLHEGTLRFFSKYGVNFATSLYSTDPATHDAITRVRGSQAKTVRALQLAVELGVPTRVGVIEMAENEGSATNVVDYITSIGVKRVGVDRLRGVGRGQEGVGQENSYEALCGACWRGRLAINSAGDVSPCVFSHFCKIGEVSEGLSKILDKQKLHVFRTKVRNMDETRQVDFCWPSPCGPNDCAPNQCGPINCGPQNCGPTQCNPI
jgi:MoaA/NifB/PqqE/SkfB family radical SAM enzyme